jgi:uncharacterized protein YkwD
MIAAAIVAAPPASGDNLRLNKSVFNDILIAQANNGCPVQARTDPRLTDAARRHTFDVRDNQIDGHLGSDGSTPADRARDSGFSGRTAETVAVAPSVAISGLAVLDQWWNDPAARAVMQDCSNTAIGVWSENAAFRTALVAVYGQPGIPQ